MLSIAAGIVGMLVGRTSHRRYRASSEQVEEIARTLGIAGTPGGMRERQGKPRDEGMRAGTGLGTPFVVEMLASVIVLLDPLAHAR